MHEEMLRAWSERCMEAGGTMNILLINGNPRAKTSNFLHLAKKFIEGVSEQHT